ncbi:nitroreductase [candidate division GN15 bacterium]|uniref:Nitroreductase n=1 Tax=candidate division GN15 bacterium TaxID=2072418 RepID=A0A855X5B3_9BACT|nr:MAG: nitroreductase [candidate division GN15 bacterium]
MSIGLRFQQETCYDTGGSVGKNIGYGARVPEFKTYDGAPAAKLPAAAAGDLSVDNAIHRRKSIRTYADMPVSLNQLTRLLIAADGITQVDSRIAHRSIPSAGALNPLEVYVAVSQVSGLDSGLYHFKVMDTSLELVKPGPVSAKLQAAALGQESVGNAPLALVITARFDRTTRKYADRGYRYVYMEVGGAMQSVYLQATALGLGTVAVGAFEDAKVNELLGLDGRTESALLILPVGYPAD